MLDLRVVPPAFRLTQRIFSSPLRPRGLPLTGDLQTLDQGEGPGYCRRKMPVCTTGAAATGAWVYFARDPSRDPALRPYTWCKRFLVDGAEEHGLAAEYIQALVRIGADRDKDQGRDGRMRALGCRAEQMSTSASNSALQAPAKAGPRLSARIVTQKEEI